MIEFYKIISKIRETKKTKIQSLFVIVVKNYIELTSDDGKKCNFLI